jgi:hypothetical protein
VKSKVFSETGITLARKNDRKQNSIATIGHLTLRGLARQAIEAFCHYLVRRVSAHFHTYKPNGVVP